MQFLFVVIAALAIGVGGIFYLNHLGWGTRLQHIWNIIRGGAGSLAYEASVLYQDSVLPAMRQTKTATIGMIALFAAMAFVIDLPVGAALIVAVLAACIGAFVWFVERQGRTHAGNEIIPANVQHVPVTHPVYTDMPIIRVTPRDPSIQHEIDNITPTGFQIRLPAVRPTVTHFAWRVTERPRGMPGLSIIVTAASAFALMAIVLFGAGIVCESRQAVMLSVAPVACAIFIFALLSRFFVWAAEKTAGIIEFGPNAAIQLSVLAMKRDFSKIDEVMAKITDSAKQAVNVANQEEFKKTWKLNLLKIIAAFSATYGVAMLVPSWKAISTWTAVQLSGWLWIHWCEYRVEYWKQQIDGAKKRGEVPSPSMVAGLESVQLRLVRLRLSGISFYIGLTALLLVMVIVLSLVPSGGDLVNTFVKDVYGAITTLFGSVHKGFDWVTGKSSGAYVPALFGAVVMGTIGGALMRKGGLIGRVAAYPFLIAMVVGFVVFAVTAAVATAQTVRDKTYGAGKLIEAPGLEAELTPTGVMLSWSAITDAQEFVIERREAAGKKFVPVTITDTVPAVVEPLDVGLTNWEDASAVKGKTYFYHLVTKTSTTKVVSEEVKVEMPKAPPAPPEETPAPSASDPKPASGKTAAVKANDCNGPSCGNAALDEYCARNPGVCAE